jgi:hypothetical protein
MLIEEARALLRLHDEYVEVTRRLRWCRSGYATLEELAVSRETLRTAVARGKGELVRRRPAAPA